MTDTIEEIRELARKGWRINTSQSGRGAGYDAWDIEIRSPGRSFRTYTVSKDEYERIMDEKWVRHRRNDIKKKIIAVKRDGGNPMCPNSPGGCGGLLELTDDENGVVCPECGVEERLEGDGDE